MKVRGKLTPHLLFYRELLLATLDSNFGGLPKLRAHFAKHVLTSEEEVRGEVFLDLKLRNSALHLK